jgi:hypothetical protein
MALWLGCGVLSYAGQMAYDRVRNVEYDHLCRMVRAAAICDQELARERSEEMLISLFGPIALLTSLAGTGLFHSGLSWSNDPRGNRMEPQR